MGIIAKPDNVAAIIQINNMNMNIRGLKSPFVYRIGFHKQSIAFSGVIFYATL